MRSASLMELRVSFESGTMQSLKAASYFHGVMASAVEPWIEDWPARDHVMDMEDAPKLRWRIWSRAEWSAQELNGLFVRLLLLREDIARLHGGTPGTEAIARMVGGWLAVRDATQGFFMEETVLAADGRVIGEPQLTLGVLGGRTVMLSTDGIMFTRLGEGLFGLALAGRGSYLMEDAGRGLDAHPLRKAS